METETIEGILRCFETISGLRVKIRISMIVGVEVEMRKVGGGRNGSAHIVRCKENKFPTTYLGLPLETIRDRSQCWIQ